MSRFESSSSGPDGVLLIDKPPGVSSRRAAAQAARDAGAARFGHAGTLDPFATGLLVVLLGRARRTQDWFTRLPKEYEATARLGAVSTTGDPEGEISVTGRIPQFPLDLPTGVIEQRPPAYSAVRVNGRRAYELARRGEPVQPPARSVEVYEFEETGRSGDEVDLRVRCSSGTYIRVLVSDLGDAYTFRLRRTAVGPFHVDDADPGRVIPIGKALPFFSSVELDGSEAQAAAHGRAVAPSAPVTAPEWVGPGAPPEEILMLEGGEAVALARRGEDGRLKPVVGFRG